MSALRRFGRASSPVVAVLLTGIGLVLALVILMAAAPVDANAGATISFRAPASEIPVGTEITVTVRLSDVVDMYAVALIIDYPADMLEIVDSDLIRPGIQAIPGQCPSPILPLGFVAENLANNESGTLSYAVTQLAPTPPVSGHCDVLHIRFRTLDGPTANLQFSSARLVDRDANELPATVVNQQLTLEEAGADVYLPLLMKG